MIQEIHNFLSNSDVIKGESFLLGVCVSVAISHLLAKDKDRQFNRAVALYEAAKRFRESLHDALLEINQGQEHAYRAGLEKLDSHLSENLLY